MWRPSISFELYDKYDYQRLGLIDDWSIDSLVVMLVSFNMQTSELCDIEDAAYHQSQLFSNYLEYFFGLLRSGKLKYENIYRLKDFDENGDLPGVDVLSTGFSTVKKEDILEYLEANNVLRLDIPRLKRFLSGDEVPNVSTSVKEKVPIAAVTKPDGESMSCSTKDDETAICDEDLPRIKSYQAPEPIQKDEPISEIVGIGDDPTDCPPKSPDSQCSFVKHGLGWNIKFGSTDLKGVKHSVGMDYIKLLLQCPYHDIGVLELQSKMNPDAIRSSRERMLEEFNGDDGADDSDVLKFDDSIAKELFKLSDEMRSELLIYNKQINELKAEYEEARLNNETYEMSRLNELISMLKDEAGTMLKSRTDDPILNANRKKVWKNIRDAKANIQTFENDNGYTDTPTYNYLDKYIETGFTCKFNPLVVDPNRWIF